MANAIGIRWLRIAGLAAGLAIWAGCSGGIHRAGEHQLSLMGNFGTAFRGDNIWPDGRGNADNAGVQLGYTYFVQDRLGLIAAASPYRNYNQRGGDVYAAELQIGLRYFFWEFDLLKVPVGLFAEALGGLQVGERSIPQNGAHVNFTQNTGVGLEARVTPNFSILGGYHLRHLSHGHVFGNEPNPSQNDHHVFLGLAFSW